jgi:hypothetical protein
MRWLDPKSPVYREPLTVYPSIVNHSLFGFGRRTCLGQNLTDAVLFCGLGGIAWAFNIKKKRDLTTGQEIDVPWNRYNSYLIIRPDPFELELTPRSEKHRRLVEQNFEESKMKDPHKEFL